MRLLRLILKGLLIALPAVLLLVTVNYTVDGTAVLQGDKFERQIADAWQSGNAVGNFTNAINERSVMRLYVDQLDEPLDTLVLGSSRCMQITQQIAGTEGAFFNSGMTGADHKDVLSTFYLFARSGKLPRHLIIGMDPWVLFDSDAALNFRSDDNLYREFLNECLGYDVEYQPEDHSLRRKALTSPGYFQENLLYYFSEHPEEESPDILPNYELDYDFEIRLADGTQYYSKETRLATQDVVDYNALVMTSVDYAQLYQFTEVSERLAGEWESFLRYAVQHGVDVTLVLTPFHPIYWEKLAVDPDYTGVAAAEQTARQIAARLGIAVYGSYDPSAAWCTGTDFYDGLHVRRESLSRFFPGVGKTAQAPADWMTEDAPADGEAAGTDA